MPKPPDFPREFASLVQVVEALRGADGCPWDKEQTHETLTRFAIEETFELVEAIEQKPGPRRDQEMVEELGDVLLQVVLHAEIARQENRFSIADVIESITTKMVRRHPHVFADTEVQSSQEVLQNWVQIKAKEKAEKKTSSAESFAVPIQLPALQRSQKIGEKTTRLKFDWADAESCWPKVDEELNELKQAIAEGNVEEMKAELGDVLFSLSQLARHLGVDAELALRETNRRFETRFFKMQTLVKSDKKNWDTLTDQEKERYWKSAKS